ncbi:MAG: hypothetical protein HY901_02895, partial [Deltaproteobacteria bacterium]|nr:hypothetical protein [Deltaproteobacteria bacterium]
DAAAAADPDAAATAQDAEVSGPDAGSERADSGSVADAGTRADAGSLAPLASAGCVTPGTRYPAGTTSGTLAFGGKVRTFRVHVPPVYQAGSPAAAVLMLHGGGGSAEQLQSESARMDPIADRDGFVTVYPDGTGVLQTWNGGLCCGKAVEEGVDDVGFLDELLDHLEGELCLDQRRVFAMGMSNGAIMSHRLACELSARIAAVAPVAGTIGVATCQPVRPVPVMQIHGTSDGHVPWDGGLGCGPAGVAFVSVPDTMEGWRTRNGCEAATSAHFQQGDGTCTAHSGCAAPVVLCSIAGGGHSWPGGEPKPGVVNCPADGAQSTTFIASEAAWQFFKANPRP